MRNDATVEETRRAQRRQLHREVVARSRVRQRERVTVLAKEEAALRQRLVRLLRARAERTNAVVRTNYTELVANQKQLLPENDQLETRIHRHYLFSRLVQFERGYVLEEERPKRRDDEEALTADDTGVWLACAALVKACFMMMKHLEQMFNPGTCLQVDVAHVLGWKAQRAIHWHNELEKKLLYFRFSRTVSLKQATLQEVQQRSWHVLSTPAMQMRLYTVPVSVQIAQTIDANTQIVFQHKAYHVPLAFMCLIAQTIDSGIVRHAMMVLDKPPPPEYDVTTSPVVWLREGLTCLTFRQVGDTVEIEFAGWHALCG